MGGKKSVQQLLCIVLVRTDRPAPHELANAAESSCSRMAVHCCRFDKSVVRCIVCEPQPQSMSDVVCGPAFGAFILICCLVQKSKIRKQTYDDTFRGLTLAAVLVPALSLGDISIAEEVVRPGLLRNFPFSGPVSSCLVDSWR